MFTIGLLHRKRIALWDFWSTAMSLSSCSTQCDWWRQDYWWRQSTAGARQRHGGKTRRDDDDTGRAARARGRLAQTVRRRRRQRRLRRRFHHQWCQLYAQRRPTVSVSLRTVDYTALHSCDNLRRLLGYFPVIIENLKEHKTLLSSILCSIRCKQFELSTAFRCPIERRSGATATDGHSGQTRTV